MKISRTALLASLGGIAVAAKLAQRPATAVASTGEAQASAAGPLPDGDGYAVIHDDATWRAKLSPESYRVLRHEATEMPGSSPLLAEHRLGTFDCAGCAQPLFDADKKFESGTGWPSFSAPKAGAIDTTTDRSTFMARTEVHCSRCGGHLGHVFDDGPKPTGLRYCMNGAALAFEPGDHA